jgi:hypothetical protein
MTKDQKTTGTSDVVPMELADMANVIGPLQEAIKAALSLSPDDFPADKEVRITLAYKVFLVPELSWRIAPK